MMKLNILEDCKDIMDVIFKLASDNTKFDYNLNNQLIRSGLSIGSNISEGSQRIGKDRTHYFNIALGSLEEARFQLYCYPNFKINEELNDKMDKIRATILKLKSSSSSSSSSSSLK